MVEMITAKGNHLVYHNNPFIDKLSVKNDGEIPSDGTAWQEWFRSRANEYEVFAHLSHSCEALHAFFPHMTPFHWPATFRRKIAAGSYIETVHDIAGVPYEFGPLFFPTEEERERAVKTKTKIGETCVGWVLSGSRIDKIYPNAPIAIARIIKELKLPVIMFGAPNEKEHAMARTILEFVEHHNGNHEGLHLAMTATDRAEPGGEMDWPIRRALSQLLVCDLVVTPDTGSAWAVAFEQMPKVVMVSHASVENVCGRDDRSWPATIALHADPERVPCWSCHRLHNDPSTCVSNNENNGAKCISDISVECVLTAIAAGFGIAPALDRLRSEWASNVTLLGKFAKMDTSPSALLAPEDALNVQGRVAANITGRIQREAETESRLISKGQKSKDDDDDTINGGMPRIKKNQTRSQGNTMRRTANDAAAKDGDGEHHQKLSGSGKENGPPSAGKRI